MRGERIAEIPPDYCGAWNYSKADATNIPWEPFDSFLSWLSQPPHLFHCDSEPIGVAVLKRVMGYKWTQIGWERFWYAHAPTRMRETQMAYTDVENNIEEALSTINVLMLSDIDRVEMKYQDRLLNILLARRRANKTTLFSVYKGFSTVKDDLQSFLMDSVAAK